MTPCINVDPHIVLGVITDHVAKTKKKKWKLTDLWRFFLVAGWKNSKFSKCFFSFKLQTLISRSILNVLSSVSCKHPHFYSRNGFWNKKSGVIGSFSETSHFWGQKWGLPKKSNFWLSIFFQYMKSQIHSIDFWTPILENSVIC